MTAHRVLAAGLLLLSASGCDRTLPPLPEAVVVVDTDLPVPLAASRLRVDMYTEEGVWFESADFSRPDPRDWPVSFSVYSDDGEATRARRVWVRLRAYLDGYTRDYRGDPRLVRDGEDVTPPSEPEPLVSVDRLVLVALEPAAKRYAPVVLHGACLGTPAVFGADPARLVMGEAESCVDTERTRTKVEALALSRDRPPASRAAAWLSDPPCPPADDASERVCVPGGATVLGTRDLISSVQIAAQPVRIFGLRRFFVDRHEVTVGRFRQALADGLAPLQMPIANDGPLGSKGTSTCTFSKAPLDREDYALSCISWHTARAFCRFTGGDLLTEAQWEHAATVAGHATKTHYPWGNELPDCDRAAYGRAFVGGKKGDCFDKGALPPPPQDSARDLNPLGVDALAAGLSEWVMDMPLSYSDPCWIDAPLVDPRCGDPDQPSQERSIRGANYLLPEMVLSTTRFADEAGGRFGPVGFRCAYAEAGP